MMTSNVFGAIAAENQGYAKVALEKTIAQGDGHCKADGMGNLQWYNQRWYEYTGTTPEEMRGWGWQSVHDMKELPRVLEKWKKAIKDGVPWEDSFPLKGKDGQFRIFLSRAIPIRDAHGAGDIGFDKISSQPNAYKGASQFSRCY